MAAPSRVGVSPDEVPAQPTFYDPRGNPQGDIWTSKTIAKGIGIQLKDANSQGREWNKTLQGVQKQFQIAFAKAVKDFCKRIEALARLQDKFQKELAKETVKIDTALSKVNVSVRAGKKGAEKKKNKVLQAAEKTIRRLEDQYAGPLFNAANDLQRTRAYFSEVLLKYWEQLDKETCERYNQFVDLDDVITHEAINIDFTGLAMLHDKVTQNGARLAPLQHVIIPKEVRTKPKMEYVPKREYLRMGAVVAKKPSSSEPSSKLSSSSSSSSTTTSSSTPSNVAHDAGLAEEAERLREENAKLQRQIKLVKLTLRNEVEENDRLRTRLEAYEGDEETSDEE